MPIIGIDLGTKNCRICAYNNEETIIIPNQLGRYCTPSIVHITKEGYVLVGDLAYEKQFFDELNTVSNFKQNLGTDYSYIIQGNAYKAYELYAFILIQLKNDAQIFLDEEITKITIGVPVYLDDVGRANLKKAATLAGLEISYFITEPAAAALQFLGTPTSNNKFLVLDFGGTFNATIVDYYRNLIELISNSYDINAGADCIDEIILNYYLQSSDQIELTPQNLILAKKQIELVKNHLDYTMNIDGKIVLFNHEILNEICQPIFKRIKKTISNALYLAEMHPAQIRDVVLTGGLSQFRLFSDFIEDLFDNANTILNEPKLHKVVNGIVLHSGLKYDEILNLDLTDLSPFSFGVSVKNFNSKPDISRILIAKHTTLPLAVKRRFLPVNSTQDTITFTIFKGENYYTKDNQILEVIKLDLPNGSDEIEPFFDITMYYNIDGVLHLEISDYSGVIFSKVLLNEDLYEEFAYVDELKSLKEINQKEKVEELTNRLNIVYSNSDLSRKSQIGELFEKLEKILDTTRINQIVRSLSEIEEKIEFWEELVFGDDYDLFTQDVMYFEDFDQVFWRSVSIFEDDKGLFSTEIERLLSSDEFDDLDDYDDFDEFDEFDDIDDIDFF